MQLSTEIKDKIIKRPDSVVIRVVTNNNGIITRSPSEHPTITNVVFDVANDSSFGDRSKRQHVSDHKGGLLTTVHELSGVHTLSGDEQILPSASCNGMGDGT
ncbi:hypothetical protein GOBAR_DD15054 [Gossypium barbadense]|nr:hypothetical protein GOBAR_DD15054 [Gossypium barbadense]